jgi:hypothetical protein
LAATLLPELTGFDVVVTLGAALVLLLGAGLAAAVPASRVLRLDPATILRRS